MILRQLSGCSLIAGDLDSKNKKRPTGRIAITILVGDEGLEPPTSSLSVTRSNQLS